LAGAVEHSAAYPQLAALVSNSPNTRGDFVQRYEQHLRTLAARLAAVDEGA
jgi:hypothetical protein